MCLGLVLVALAPTAFAQPASPAFVTADGAAAAALSDLSRQPGGILLEHPAHTAAFSATGLDVRGTHGGPAWRWSLAAVRSSASEATHPGVFHGGVAPVRARDADGTPVVRYDRGGVVEAYHSRARVIEQRFVVNAPLALAGGDLVVEGRVDAEGAFAAREGRGWTWSTEAGAVSLGDVTVFDATGRQIAARMDVEADRTTITVDGAALATAVYPVTIDPEIGANDFRISDAGGDGDAGADAGSAAVAYNATDNEYLVVWTADDTDSGTVAGENEIFGQRIDGATGAEVGTNDFRISDSGGTGDSSSDAIEPAVVWNSTDNEYLVVWRANDTDAGLAATEIEIFGQRIDGPTGAEVGTNDFRISDAGGTGDVDISANDPVVAYNATNNEYLVVWEADDTDATGVVNNEREIFGQRLAASGAEVGTNDFRISDVSGNGVSADNGTNPSVVWNSTDNEYLVVWQADDTDTAGIIPDEFEIYGQRIDGATGAEVGTNDFRISDASGTGNIVSAALDPYVAYNATDNEYLVVWQSDDTDAAGVVDQEYEIFGQRLAGATGAEVGPNDFRISQVVGDEQRDAYEPKVAWNSTDNEYLVVWRGESDEGGVVNNEYEIYGQRLDAAGNEIGAGDLRLSDVAGTGDANFDANAAAVAYNASNNEYLALWNADDIDTAGIIDAEDEIFGQRLSFASTLSASVGEGWRMLATPGPAPTIGDVMGPLWTQGFTGADVTFGTTNVYVYDETVAGDRDEGYTAPASQTVALTPGTGYFTYVFADDDQGAAGVQGGFPKSLSATAAGPGADVIRTLSCSNGCGPDDGWHLFGNPFFDPIGAEGFTFSNVGTTVYVYDPSVPGYVEYDTATDAGGLTGGVIAAYQGFFVQATADGGQLTVPVAAQTLNGPSGGSPFLGRQASPAATIAFDLTGEVSAGGAAATVGADAYVTFWAGGDAGRDGSDAIDLAPPASAYASLFTQPVAPFGGTAEAPVAPPLALQSLPVPEGPVEVGLGVRAVAGEAASGTFVLTWSASSVPDAWSVRLVDRVTHSEIDLRAASSYAFEVAEGVDATERFVLKVSPSAVTADEAGPAAEAAALMVGPNPTSARTTLRYRLPQGGPARVSVVDVLGREVAVLADGLHTEAWHTVGFDAGALAPGVYVVRVSAGGAVLLSRALTVVR